MLTSLTRQLRVYATLAAAALCATSVARAEPVQPSAQRIMLVVAHQDDDHVIMVPDLLDAIRERRTIQTVYLTSGDAGFTCNAYTQGREQGVKAAQAQLAGVANRWVDEERIKAGKRVRISRLAGTNMSMVFLGLPNPALLSEAPPEGALQLLWLRQLASVSTLPYDGRSGVDVYTREQLIEVLRTLMNDLSPQDVRVLDASQQQIPIWPFEHVDHMASAMFATAAFQRYARADALTFYPIYSTQFLPANLSSEMVNLRRSMFDAYRPFDAKMCRSLLTTICDTITFCDPVEIYDPFFSRSYAVDTVRRANAQLRSPGGSCLDVVLGSVRSRACDGTRSAQRWTLERGGVMRNVGTGQCLAAASANAGQTLSMRACKREPAQQFYLTTQGQLRGPDATCVREGALGLTLEECTVDWTQMPWQ